jgi:hypothetical protein
MPRTDLWTREEMILALNLYLKLPFGKMRTIGTVPVVRLRDPDAVKTDASQTYELTDACTEILCLTDNVG